MDSRDDRETATFVDRRTSLTRRGERLAIQLSAAIERCGCTASGTTDDVQHSGANPAFVLTMEAQKSLESYQDTGERPYLAYRSIRTLGSKVRPEILNRFPDKMSLKGVEAR